MGEAIVVTSGKGGVGKSTTTANLGTVLALAGKKVCLVDSDIGLRNLDVLMGLDNRIIYDIVDVAQGRCRVSQALVKDKRFDCLYLLPAAQTKDKTDLQSDDMERLINELKEEYDYILIDCAAGIEQGFQNAIIGADQAVVVTTPDTSAVRDADRVIGILEKQEHIAPPQLVINRIRKGMVDEGQMMDVDEVINVLAIDLLGVVVDDNQVISSANRGEPIAFNPQTKPAIAFRNIGRRLLGESVPLMSLEEKQGFFVKLKKWLGFGSKQAR